MSALPPVLKSREDLRGLIVRKPEAGKLPSRSLEAAHPRDDARRAPGELQGTACAVRAAGIGSCLDDTSGQSGTELASGAGTFVGVGRLHVNASATENACKRRRRGNGGGTFFTVISRVVTV